MTFRDLPIGQAFNFANSYSGAPNGPWIKTGTRTYYRPCDVKYQQDIARTYNLKGAKFNSNRVGSVKVEVLPVTLDAAQLAEVAEVTPLLTSKLVR